MILVKVPDSIAVVLQELSQELQSLYKNKLCGIYLYGSYARGTQHDGSDVDIMVVLQGAIKPGAEITRMNHVVSRISIDHNLLISVVPISSDKFEDKDPFLDDVLSYALKL